MTKCTDFDPAMIQCTDQSSVLIMIDAIIIKLKLFKLKIMYKYTSSVQLNVIRDRFHSFIRVHIICYITLFSHANASS